MKRLISNGYVQKKHPIDSELVLELLEDGQKKRKSNVSILLEDIKDSTFATELLNTRITPQTSRHRQHPKKRRKLMAQSTVECHQINKKTTSSVKYHNSNNSIPSIPSSQTSALDSTTREKVYRGFWNESKKEISTKLWWPTKTGWRDLGQISSNGSSISRGHLSSFKTAKFTHQSRNLLKTLWQSYTFSHAGSTEKEDTKKLNAKEKTERSKIYKTAKNAEEEKTMKLELQSKQKNRVNRALHVRIHPNDQQRLVLKRWFRDARKTYNLCMQHVISNKWHKDDSMPLNLIEKKLSTTFVSAQGLENRGKQVLLLRTPKVIRQQSMKSVISVLKAHRTKLENHKKKKTQKPFKFNPQFKSRGLSNDSIGIEKCSFNYVSNDICSIYKNYDLNHTLKYEYAKKFKQNLNEKTYYNIPKFYVMRNIKTSNQLHNDICNNDFKIHFTHGNFYMMFSKPIDVEKDQRCIKSSITSLSSSIDKIVSIDPGVRKFATTYSPEGVVNVFGTNTQEVLRKLVKGVNKHKKLYRQLRRKKKRRRRRSIWKAKKKYHKMEKRVKNVIKDFHYKVSHQLLRENQTIILPTTTSHYWRQGKHISKETKRMISMLSFGSFANRLVQTSTFYRGSKIIRLSESYTSKQCGHCGHINDGLKSNETFSCKKCKKIADRDVHGARNILLKCLETK